MTNVFFELSIDETWSNAVGIKAACDKGYAQQLIENATTGLDYATTMPGSRGAEIETLIAISLQLADDLPTRIGALVADAGNGLGLKMPSWYVALLVVSCGPMGEQYHY
jgi:hypothetical protein